MGSYLAKPVTNKQSVNATVSICGNECQYAVTTMQGWRISMEDCCTVLPDFEDNSILLGVFDGHGGPEVAEYCKTHIETFVKESKHYNGNIPMAFKEAYVACDKALLSSEGQKELKRIIADTNNHSTEEEEETFGDTESEDDITKLQEEATMPLEQVLKGKVDAKSVVKSLTGMANKELDRSKRGGHGGSSQEEGRSISDADMVQENDDYVQELLGFVSKSLSSKLLRLVQDGGMSDSDESDESDGSDDDTEMVDNEEEDNIERETERKNDEDKDKRDGERDKEVLSGTESLRQQRKRKRDMRRDEEESNSKRHPTYNDEIIESYECGTTAVVCLVKGDELIVANAGDSRCVLSCDGKARNLSEDHAPTNPVEQARIEKAGGVIDEDLRVNGGLNLSRAIGDHMYKQNNNLSLEEQMISPLPDITTMTLSSKDEFIIMASDGIWNCTTSQDVIDFVRQRLINLKNGKPISDKTKEQSQTISLICEELFDMCLAPNTDNDGSGCDNMTVILLLLKPLDSLF